MEITYSHVLEEVSRRKQYFRAFCTEQFLRKVLTFEIGCGHGHFLTSYAQNYPLKLFVGIDLCTRRINQASKKQEMADLSNLHFIKAEASEFIECLPDDTFLDQIFILFPDPWPKNRHHKNRLIQQDFLELLAKKSMPGAMLYVRTDHERYFKWTEKEMIKSPFWQIYEGVWPFEHESVFQKKMQSYQSLMAVRL